MWKQKYYVEFIIKINKMIVDFREKKNMSNAISIMGGEVVVEYNYLSVHLDNRRG